MPDQEIRVSVEKELPMVKDESVNDFLDLLRREVTKWAKDEFKLGEKGHAWPRDVFGDAVVVEVYKSTEDGIQAGEHLFQAPYSRKGVNFEFGKPVAVVRRVTYVPVSKADVNKSFWGGVL